MLPQSICFHAYQTAFHMLSYYNPLFSHIWGSIKGLVFPITFDRQGAPVSLWRIIVSIAPFDHGLAPMPPKNIFRPNTQTFNAL